MGTNLLAAIRRRRHDMQSLVGQCTRAPHPGFTLVELLVVIAIIGLVSVIALPVVLPAIRHRQVSEAARTLQGTLVGARDQAIHDGQPSGIRLLPDPTYPITRLPNGQIVPGPILAYNRVIPIGPAPNYSEGRVSIHEDVAGGSSQYPAAIRTVGGHSGVPCLVLEQSVTDKQGLPNAPTSWFWNIRVGDRIQPNNSGPWYTVVGPMTISPSQGNSEMFVNNGPAGTALPILVGGKPCEYLLLVNGRDDNGNGWVDEGYDGVDNNGDGLIDDGAEWERERWIH